LTDKRRHRHHDEATPAVDDTQAPATAEAPPAADAPAAASSEGGLDAVEEPLSREAMALIRQERNDLRDQLLRKRADFENFRKRVERDRQQASLEAKATIFRELIPTLDNLESALKAGGDADALRTGVELTRRELLGILENHGIVAEDPTGGPFDPERHQALSHEAVPGFADGTVVEVFRKGYRLKDRLLRPALVKVAKEADSEGEDTSDGIH
jgi:molecular chaperone GrpE